MDKYRFRGGGYKGTGGYRSGGYGGGGMTLNFPPFSGAVKRLVLINVIVFFALLVTSLFAPSLVQVVNHYARLVPYSVLHGALWQLATYSFLNLSILGLALDMLQLWMFGSALEEGWGRRKFYEFYFWTVLGGALFAIVLAYTGIFGGPNIPVAGPSAGVMGILIAFGMLYGDREIMLFPIPVSIKAKYFVAILVLLNLAGLFMAIAAHAPLVAYGAPVGGGLFAFIYVRYIPRAGFQFLGSERYYGVRNSYYKWKRRRAARKFEVYMRKHDKNEYFDQYGNYKAPDDKEKGNGESGRGGWVN